jgi:tetratricopeptide (TPR) repeat protein
MNARTLIEIARQHEGQEAWDQAREAYQQALALEPDNVEGYARLGVVCARQDRLDEALRHYGTALKLDPTRVDAHWNLAMLHKRQGRMDEALHALEEFLTQARSHQDIARGREALNEMAGLSYTKCARCGSISTLGDFYRGAPPRAVCPRCQPGSQVKSSALLWAFLAIVTVVAAAVFRPIVPSTYYLMVNVASSLALAYFLIIPHELCHALATWLAGGRVFEIRIGMGQVVWTKRFRDLTISLNRYPLSGATVLGYATPSNLRLRHLAAVSAGMAFSASMILLLIPFASIARFTSTYAFVEALLLANSIILLSSLLPNWFGPAAGTLLSDGVLLARLLSGKMPERELHATYYVNKGAYDLRAGAYDQALEAGDDGLALYPGNTLLGNVRAVALLELERHAEAQDQFEDLLARLRTGEQDDELAVTGLNRHLLEAILLNNVAYASLLSQPDPGALQRARDSSRRAFRLAPWIPSIQGTWGSLLVETGEIEKGIKHLAEVAGAQDTDRAKAANLAYTAIGHHRLGDAEQAATLLQQATTLDPTGYIVRQAQAEHAAKRP